jgi:hypothetical protein
MRERGGDGFPVAVEGIIHRENNKNLRQAVGPCVCTHKGFQGIVAIFSDIEKLARPGKGSLS